jgi:hypothetical protein
MSRRNNRSSAENNRSLDESSAENDEMSFTQEEMRDEVSWEEPTGAAALLDISAISAAEPGKPSLRKM